MVTVTYPDGSTDSTTADASGNYGVTTHVPQTTGEVTATATDEAGNTSDPATKDYTDATAPQPPQVEAITPNDDGGLTVSGTAEPGSTVSVTYPDGSTDTTTADASGNYEVTTHVPQTTGEVTATATDAAGNTSDPATHDYTDATAPHPPMVLAFTQNDDGGLTVSGTAEPGSTVTVT